MSEPHIMIMDDEPEIGEMIRRLAKRQGRPATVLSDPRVFRERYLEIRPSTVLLDIIMPHVDGLELAQWIAEQDHKARVVLMSGYNPHYMEVASVLARHRGGLAITTLIKPLSRTDLLPILCETLPDAPDAT